MIAEWADDFSKLFDWNIVNDGTAILAAWEQFDGYVEGLISQRRKSITDDLISDLIRAEDDGDQLTHDELLMLAASLLTAGTDTTRNQLASAVLALCDHPRSVRAVGHPSRVGWSPYPGEHSGPSQPRSSQP